MKEFKYKVTVDYLEDNQGNKQDCPPLVFEAANHDDIFKIINMTKKSGGAMAEEAVPFVIGLKLFTDVCMKRRNDPPFDLMKPHIAEIMKIVKSQVKKPTE